MTPGVAAWLAKLPPSFVTGSVVEVGAGDVNGSAATILRDLARSWLATDIEPGPGIDVVVSAERLPLVFGMDRFDTVVCTETLEHVEQWRRAVFGMMCVLHENGHLILTTRSPGFPRHEYPGDHWRFTRDDLEAIFDTDLRMIASDAPEHPGVMAVIRKPFNWHPITFVKHLHTVTVAPAPIPEPLSRSARRRLTRRDSALMIPLDTATGGAQRGNDQ